MDGLAQVCGRQLMDLLGQGVGNEGSKPSRHRARAKAPWEEEVSGRRARKKVRVGRAQRAQEG